MQLSQPPQLNRPPQMNQSPQPNQPLQFNQPPQLSRPPIMNQPPQPNQDGLSQNFNHQPQMVPSTGPSSLPQPPSSLRKFFFFKFISVTCL